MVIKIKADLELVPQKYVTLEPTSECTGCVFDPLIDLTPCQQANAILRCDDDRFTENMVYTIKNANVKERVL